VQFHKRRACEEEKGKTFSRHFFPNSIVVELSRKFRRKISLIARKNCESEIDCRFSE
jgi:hypothetical protein